MVVALEPAPLHLPHISGVVSGVQRAQVVDNSEQRVTVIFEDTLRRVAIVNRINRPPMRRHKRRHIEFGGKRHERRYLSIDLRRVLEPFEMETGDYWQSLQSQLLRRFAVGSTVRALNLGRRAQMFGPGEALEAGLEGARAGDVQAYVPERVDGRRHSRAGSADDVTLQAPREYLINDAVATSVFFLFRIFNAVHAVPVQHVQRGDEELVRVLLLVAREVARVRPDEVQQAVQRQRRLGARVELLE